MYTLRRERKIIIFGFWFLAFCFAFACAPRVAIREEYDFGRIERIAVLNFVNYLEFENSGSAVADEFVRQLMLKHFDVVERSRLHNILQERRLAEKEILDPSTVKEIGKVLGVDVFITGTVTKFIPEHKDIVYVRDESGGKKWDIVVFDAEAAIHARMIDVETGLVVWSGSYSYESFDIESVIRYTVSRLLVPFYKRARMR